MAQHQPRARDLFVPQLTHSQSGTYSATRVREVLTLPAPFLASRAHKVDPRDPRVVSLSIALMETMRASPACIGLAATQIGESAHLFVMDVTGHPKAKSCAGLVTLANARIVEQRGNVVMREGCMSVPHLTGNILRAREVVVEGEEPGTGRKLCVTADAMEARCLQHEIDHLDGLVFLDRIYDPSRDLFTRKTYAESRGGGDDSNG
jgi:peptide deformylase